MSAKTFHSKMLRHLDEYQEHLGIVKSKETAITHYSIVHEFLDFLNNKNLVGAIDQITVSMANSKFMAEYRRQNKEVISKEEMKEVLKGYFVFIDGKYGLRNEILMNGLGK